MDHLTSRALPLRAQQHNDKQHEEPTESEG